MNRLVDSGGDIDSAPSDFGAADELATAVVYLTCTAALYHLGEFTGSRLYGTADRPMTATDASDTSTDGTRRDNRGR